MNSNPIVQQLFSRSDHQAKKKKPAPKPQANPYENPFDAFKDLGVGMVDSVKDQAKAAKGDIFKQVFGGDKLFHGKSAGDMSPGQEISFAQQKKQQEQQKSHETKANIRPAMDYVGEILRAGETANEKESHQTKQDIQSLIMEIKKLGAATKALEHQVTEATGTTLVKPGRYHKSFFRYVLSVIRDAKAKVDNAGTWLSAMKGKQRKGMGGNKKPKTNYWDLAKKHGNNFTLSGERSVSTQVG